MEELAARGRATQELLPLGKVMWASSGKCCKRCITLIRGRRRRDGHIDNSIVGRGRSWVVVVMRVKLEAYYVGRAGVGEVATGYSFGLLEMESLEVTKPAARGPTSRQTVPKASRMALLGAASWYWQKKGGHRKGQKGGGNNDRSCWQVGQGR
jgi:hypothetical protein